MRAEVAVARIAGLRAVAAAMLLGAAAMLLGGCAATSDPVREVVSVRINEIMPSNASVLADDAGEHDDWIEIYNPSDRPLSLAGFALSDDPRDLTKEPLAGDLGIEPGGVLLLWADGQRDQGAAHLAFKLDAGGETVILTGPDGDIVDRVEYADAPTDVSFARHPDGEGAFALCGHPTPGERNGRGCGAP